MNKSRLNQILNILLMPYREQEFYEIDKDVIAGIRYSFAELKSHEKNKLKVDKFYRGKYYVAENNLKEFISKHDEFRIHTWDDFRLFLDLFFSEVDCSRIYGVIEKDQRFDKHLYKYVINYKYLENIYNIAHSLLTFRDGKIAIRTWINDNDDKDIFRYPNVFDKVEVWNLLGRMITTDILVVAFYIDVGLEDEFYMCNQTGGILLADKTLEKILEKGVAETHVHFNAGVEFLYLWQNRMVDYLWEKKILDEKEYQNFCGDDKGNFIIMIYRMIWAEYMEVVKDNQMTFKQFINRAYPEYSEMLNEMFQQMIKGNICFYSDNWKDKYNSLRVFWKHKFGINGEVTDLLLDTVYKKYISYNTYSEILFLFNCLLYFKSHISEIENLQLFFQYIRSKNIFFKCMAQSNQTEGLLNFQEYFRKMSKVLHESLSVENRYDIIFKSLIKNSHLKKLEVRISPYVRTDWSSVDSMYIKEEVKRKLLKSVKSILKVYKKNLLQEAGINERDGEDINVLVNYMDIPYQKGNKVFPTLGIVFHYIKQESVDNRIGDTCWVKDWKEIKKSSQHILVWRETLVRNVQVLEELRSEIPLLAEYVVGIDAASEENRTEPWVFAPMYAAVRNRSITKPILRDCDNQIYKINNLGFTYHVGEEYRHLLSGFRHIDEVICHFHYKSGDRLGHAIALGVDVDLWIEKNEVVVIPIQEYMEDLLWLWGKMVHKNWRLDINSESIEGKILEYAKAIYGAIDGLSVTMLYDAYKEKFKRNYMDRINKLKEELILENPDIKNCKEVFNHFCKFYKMDSVYGVMWTMDKLFCTFFCPVYYQRANKPIMVYVKREDNVLLKQIQNYMVNEVERLGVYIETNPTSNLNIGEINSLYAPPIFNMNSKGLSNGEGVRHEMLVSVNSDDPLVFNTNSENELAYMYHALGYQGYSKETVLEWIDKVRQMGLDSSFVKKEKRPSQQIIEITELIEFCLNSNKRYFELSSIRGIIKF